MDKIKEMHYDDGEDAYSMHMDLEELGYKSWDELRVTGL